MSLQTLLSLLADGQFHSGDELGQLLGVSRTAVWKQLKKVEELGLPLSSIKGRGYCIEGGLDLLSREEILQSLSDDAKSHVAELDVRHVVSSTSDEAMSKAVAGNKGYVCTTEQQSSGRGRRGRSWISPYAGNLYFSVVWEFVGGAAALEGLSLAVGVSMVDALTKSGVEGLQLKWPNDVLHQDKKLAGVLLEMTGDAAGPCQVVIGIGLNVYMNQEKAQSITQPWTDLSSITSQPLCRSQLQAVLLNELMPMLVGFESEGFAAYRDRWMNLDAFSGQEVCVKLGTDRIFGAAVGVDETGAIVINTPKGRRVFSGGEVSLRRVQ